MNEFVDLLPAQQRMDEETGYRGTADVVPQNQDILDGYHAEPWRCSVAITSTR